MAQSATGTLETTGNLLFYKKVEPLNYDVHGKLGVSADPEHPFVFAKDTQIVPVTVSEFGLASLSYPVIFAGKEHTPAVVMGLQQDHNAWIDADGRMPDGIYLPGFMRRYPFVSATNNGDAQNLMVCIDRSAPFICENADEPFFVAGKPSDFTNRAIEFIQAYEAETLGTRNFIQIMEELDLFDTQDVTIPQQGEDGKSIVQQKIGEFVGLSQAKLNLLSPEKLAELRDNGALSAVYAQMISQANWPRLVAQEMKNPAPGEAIGEPEGQA